VAAARAGDDRAFEQLYGRYQRRIAAYVHGMVKDHGRSEDITQEVFLSALRRMRETERPITFKPWIYEIAKNACIDAFRRSRRTDEVSYDADEGLGAGDHLKLVSSGPTPDAAVEGRMALDDLRGAFGGLSDAHHDILVMRELEGRSYREIGERLGMSRSSVESTLFRARRRLSEEYEELVSGKRCEQFQRLIGQAAEAPLGARGERKMARHVSHCQPCRRAAGLAGLDVAAMAEGRGMRAKIAALLPLPAFLKRRWLPETEDGGAGASLSHWSTMAAQYAEPMSGWAKAATVAATVALAGAGVGAATSQGDPEPAVREPAPTAPAAPTQSSRPTSGVQTTSADRSSGARSGATGATRPAGGDRPSSAASPGGARTMGRSDGGAGSATGGGSASSGGGVVDRASGAAGDAVKTTVPKAVGGATDTVGAVTTTTGKVVGETTGTLASTVEKTAQTATGTVTGITKTVTDAVPRTTSTVTDTLDTATNGATSGVTGTVDKTATTAAGAVQGAAGTATGAVDRTVGTATGAVETTATAATGAAGGLLGGK
jgi:RNA polymerase sigma factor (sigma-70 family)